MAKTSQLIVIGALLLLGVSQVRAQERDDRATILNFKGIQYKSNDSLFYVNFRFRMQNRLGFKQTMDGVDKGNFDARIRRLRMRMDGYIYTPKISTPYS